MNKYFGPDYQVLEPDASHLIDPHLLVGVTSLQNALEVFGVKPGDRVETRDLLLMTTTVRKELRTTREAFLRAKDYDSAAKIRDRLTTINEEFRSMQKSNETRRQHDEENTFEEATRKIWNQRLKLCEANESETRGSNEERMEDLVKRHHVEREQLEAYLKSWHKPPVRYSKALLEMMHSESHLARLDQFEEANTLRRRVNQVQPKEVAQHKESIENRFRALRETQRTRQSFELRKLEEKLHDMRLRTTRVGTQGDDEMRRRLRNHQNDMRHKHTLNTNQVPLFCAVVGGKVRPVNKERKGYKGTDATFRGTQLLSSVQGGGTRGVVGVPSLCELHDFAKEDPNCKVYSGRREV